MDVFTILNHLHSGLNGLKNEYSKKNNAELPYKKVRTIDSALKALVNIEVDGLEYSGLKYIDLRKNKTNLYWLVIFKDNSKQIYNFSEIRTSDQ